MCPDPGAYFLAPAAEADMRALMKWFPDAASTRIWGGPSFRFPFTFESFIADARWPGMSSWCLRSDDELLGFGQYYDLYHRIHLARISVHPAMRGQGFGRHLLSMLMHEASKAMDAAEFSLFVYRDNEAAIRCYAASGFEVADFPEGAPLRDVTCYMVRSKG
ncbi:MAG: GNAT family N-acetyltransferase [Woeseiaceae bacterium]